MKAGLETPPSVTGRRDAGERWGARIAPPLVWALCSLCLALAGGSVLLGVFNGRTPGETDLETLSYDLLGVARETMQPARVYLWLRPPGGAGKGEE